MKDEIYLYDFKGTKITRLAPDFVGAANITGRRDKDHFFVTLTGFTSPGTVARYDFTVPLTNGDHSARWSVYSTTEVKGLDLDKFESSQVWYSSPDGTKVPMFLVKHKDTPFDGTAPALQYGMFSESRAEFARTDWIFVLTGYGGFTISINPFFSPSILTFLQKYGAILAVPNIRGGGEFGEEWHQAAIKEKKVSCSRD